MSKGCDTDLLNVFVARFPSSPPPPQVLDRENQCCLEDKPSWQRSCKPEDASCSQEAKDEL